MIPTLDKLAQTFPFKLFQKKILLFFGGLDTNLHHCLLPDSDELGHVATALESERHLRFSVPFPDAKPSIYLVKIAAAHVKFFMLLSYLSTVGI